MTEKALPETTLIAALAELFGVTTRQTRNLLEGAKVKPLSRGSWPLAAAVRAVLGHAREAREPDALAAARARVLNAKAQAQEIALARQERELIPIEDANFVMDELVATVRGELDGLPARITRDIELRRKIEAELHAAQKRMVAKLKDAAAEIRNGENGEHDDE